MQFAEDTFETIEQNLAADEIALQRVALGQGEGILRLWEVRSPVIVLGMGGRWQDEVLHHHATTEGIPVVRRSSGGGTVLLAPGCLNYSLILASGTLPDPLNPSATNDWIMERHRSLCAQLSGREVVRAGCSDLAVAGRKFSGNAQRRCGAAVLFHGTFLLHMDLDLVGRVLQEPSRRPEYRQGRSHADFLTNLNLHSADLSLGLRQLWGAADRVALVVDEWAVAQSVLLRERYANPEWNLRR